MFISLLVDYLWNAAMLPQHSGKSSAHNAIAIFSPYSDANKPFLTYLKGRLSVFNETIQGNTARKN